jgi:hypothetical protein
MTTINFTLPLTAGGGASFPLLNATVVMFPSDADYDVATLAPQQLAAINHSVQGTISVTRNIYYPRVGGLLFFVVNATTGSQMVRITDSVTMAGGGVTISPGDSAWVYFNGSEYESLTVGGGGSPDASTVTYEPGTPGNWSPTPAFVAAALDQLAARGQGVQTTFVFQPGGATSGNVYSTLSGLEAAIAATSGAVTICFDLSFSAGAYTFPSGAVNLGQVTTWTSLNSSSAVVLTFNVPGTSLAYPPIRIETVLQAHVHGSGTLCALSEPYLITSLCDDAIINSQTGAYFVDPGSNQWILEMHDSSGIVGDVLNTNNGYFIYCLDIAFMLPGQSTLGTGGRVVNGSPGTSIDPYWYPVVNLAGVLVDTSGTATSVIPPGNEWTAGYILENGVLYYSDGSTWTAITGGGGPVDASTVTYTPGTPGDWETPPTEVAQALDELAASDAEYTSGSGIPCGTVTADIGVLYIDTSTGRLWQNIDGVKTWVGAQANGTVTWCPDGTDTPTSFTSFADLCQYVTGEITSSDLEAAGILEVTIIVDLSAVSGGASIGTGPFTLPNVTTFIGNPDEGPGSYVQFGDGVHSANDTILIAAGATNARIVVKDVEFSNLNVVTAPIQVSTGISFWFELQGVALVQNDSSASTYFLDCFHCDQVFVDLHDQSSLIGAGSFSVVGNSLGGEPTGTIRCYDQSTLSTGGAELTSTTIIEPLSGGAMIDDSYIAYLKLTPGIVFQTDQTDPNDASIPGTTGCLVSSTTVNGATLWVYSGTSWSPVVSGDFDVTFQPGGTIGPGIYTNQNSLTGVLSTQQSSNRVYLDFSQNSDTYTATGNIGIGSGQGDVTIIGVINTSNGLAPTFVAPSTANYQILPTPIEVRDVLLVGYGSGGGELFDSYQPLFLRFTGQTSITDPSGNSGGWVVQSPNTCVLCLEDQSSIGDGTNFVVEIETGATQQVNVTSQPLLGGYSVLANAFNVNTGGALVIYCQSTNQIDPSYFSATGVTVHVQPSPSIVTSIVFQPGGSTVNNVYADETSLATATQTFNGAEYTIFFDLSLVSGSYTFTTVGAVDLAPNGTWVAAGDDILIFANGTTLTNPPVCVKGRNELGGGLDISVTQTETVCVVTGVGGTTFEGTSGAGTDASGAGAFIDVQTGLGYWDILLKDSSYGYGYDTGTHVFTGSSGTIRIWAYEEASVGAYIAGPTLNELIVASTSVSVDGFDDPSLYGSVLSIRSLFYDATGTGPTTIPAGGTNSGTYMLSTPYSGGGVGGGLWYSTGTAWIPLTTQSGTATLSSGTVTVSTAYVTSTSTIVAMYNTQSGGAYGLLTAPLSSRSPGAPGSFVITSTDLSVNQVLLDNSTVDWFIQP